VLTCTATAARSASHPRRAPGASYEHRWTHFVRALGDLCARLPCCTNPARLLGSLGSHVCTTFLGQGLVAEKGPWRLGPWCEYPQPAQAHEPGWVLEQECTVRERGNKTFGAPQDRRRLTERLPKARHDASFHPGIAPTGDAGCVKSRWRRYGSQGRGAGHSSFYRRCAAAFSRAAAFPARAASARGCRGCVVIAGRNAPRPHRASALRLSTGRERRVAPNERGPSLACHPRRRPCVSPLLASAWLPTRQRTRCAQSPALFLPVGARGRRGGTSACGGGACLGTLG
jgi:hypothetical protein